MHIRKVTKASEAWSLPDLINAIVTLLSIDLIFGTRLSEKKAATS